MKTILGVLLIIIMAHEGLGQVYDGITQPTTFRYLMPINISQDNEVSASPFIGLKQGVTSWLSFTGIMQYNIKRRAIMPSLWINANYKGRAYLLLRNTLNSNTGEFSNTLSGTYRAGSFHTDFTWYNIQAGGEVMHNDRLQMLIGYDFGLFILNAGTSVIGSPGLVSNLRIRLTKLSWLQFRYDTATKQLGVITVVHI